MEREPLYVTTSELVGEVAHWAVRQSPYPVPERLEAALSAFAARVEDDFGAELSVGHVRLKKFADAGDLERYLEETLLPIPEVAAWNERRNGRDGPGFVAAFMARPDPDDDFVDLHALIRNVAMGIARDHNWSAEVDEAAHRIAGVRGAAL